LPSVKWESECGPVVGKEKCSKTGEVPSARQMYIRVELLLPLSPPEMERGFLDWWRKRVRSLAGV
jgi:hypothetical protein